MVKIAFDAIKLLPLFGVYIWLSLWENNNKSRMFGLVFFLKQFIVPLVLILSKKKILREKGH